METNSSPRAGELTPVQLERLQGLSACVVASAIELSNVRLPNTGFSDAHIRCIYEDLPPMVAAVHGPSSRISRATWPRVPADSPAGTVPELFTTPVCRKWDARGKFYATRA